MRKILAGLNGPKSLIYTVNAGSIPSGHWTQRKQTGGGRVVGEGCHFIDFLRFLIGSPIAGFVVEPMLNGGFSRDTATLTLRFIDGSIGTIHYFANGARSLSKERVEVFAEGRVLQMENFRRLAGHGWSRSVGSRLWRPDKGQANLTALFVRRIRDGGPQLIPFDQLWEVSRISILAQQAIDAR